MRNHYATAPESIYVFMSLSTIHKPKVQSVVIAWPKLVDMHLVSPLWSSDCKAASIDCSYEHLPPFDVNSAKNSISYVAIARDMAQSFPDQK